MDYWYQFDGKKTDSLSVVWDIHIPGYLYYPNQLTIVTNDIDTTVINSQKSKIKLSRTTTKILFSPYMSESIILPDSCTQISLGFFAVSSNIGNTRDDVKSNHCISAGTGDLKFTYSPKEQVFRLHEDRYLWDFFRKKDFE